MPGGACLCLEGRVCAWKGVSVPGGACLCLEGHVCAWRGVSVPGRACLCLERHVCAWRGVSVPGGACLCLEGRVRAWKGVSVPGRACLCLEGRVCAWRGVSVPGGACLCLEGRVCGWRGAHLLVGRWPTFQSTSSLSCDSSCPHRGTGHCATGPVSVSVRVCAVHSEGGRQYLYTTCLALHPYPPTPASVPTHNCSPCPSHYPAHLSL